MNIHNDPTQKIPPISPDPGFEYESPREKESVWDKVTDMMEDDWGYVLFMAVLAFVVVILIVSGIEDGGGPATESVKACATIENPEASKACFEAIARD